MTSPLMMPTRRADHAADVRHTRPTGHRFIAPVEVDDAHCFVCGKHTDHWGEHDELVEAGLATYGDDGSVRRTAAWDDDLAQQLFEAEYTRRHPNGF